MARDYSIEFKLAGEIAGSFFKTMQGAQSALNDVNQALGGLDRVQADVGRMIELQNGLGDAGQKMRDAQARAAELSQQLTAARAPAAALADRYGVAEQRVESLAREMGAAQKRSQELSVQQQKAKAGVDALAAAMAQAEKPSAELSAQYKQAKAALSALGSEVTEANAQTKNLRDAHRTAKGELKNLSAEMRTNQKNTRDLEREHNKASIEADKAEQAFSRQNETLADLAKSTKMADAGVADLAARQSQLQKATEAATKAQQDLQRINAAKQANLDNRANLRGQLMDAVALGATIAVPVKLAVDFESAMADVKKVVDFDTPDGFAKMNADVLEMSRRLPMAAKDIAAIVAAGGQSGIAANDLGFFAESAIKAGVAFGMTADQAGQMMAEMRTAFGMEQDAVNTLMDQINLLANTGAASESVIASIVQRVGPLGDVAGVAARDIAALGSTLAGMGVKEEVAATGIQNFMLAMVAGESATKKQKAVLESLGMTAEEVAAGMQADSKATMIQVLQGIKGLEKETQAAALVQFFGKESVKSIAPLMDQLGLLAENFDKVADAQRYAGAVAKEYEARAATSENAMQLLRNKLAALGITLGATLLPAINNVMAAIGPVLDAVASFAMAYPQVTTAVVGLTAALIAGKVAAIGGGYAYTFVRGAVLSVQGAFATARAAILLHSGALAANATTSKTAVVAARAMAAAQWLLNGAMLANPIGLVVAGIAGLVAAGVVLYRNWDTIAAFFKGVWAGMAPAMEPIFAAFNDLKTAVAPLLDMLGNAWNWFKSLFTPVNASAEALENAAGAGRAVGSVLGTVFKVVSAPMVYAIKGVTMFTNAVGTLAGIVVDNFDTIKNVFLNFTPIGWVVQAWGAVFDFFGAIDFTGDTSRIIETARAAFLNFAPVQWVMGAWDSLTDWFANFSLYDSGAKLLQTLADGIKSAVSAPVDAVKGALAKVRDYLPFSDAKVGPLSELTASGQAILDTLGEGMRLAPMPDIVAPLSQIQKAANDAAQILPPNVVPFVSRAAAAQGAPATTSAINEISNVLHMPERSAFEGEHGYKTAQRREDSGAGGNQNQGGITVHFAPVITISGGGSDAYEQARQGVAAGAEDLERRLRSIERERRRLSYD